MQRGSILSYVLIVVLVLMLFGYVSLGDVLSVIFYIMGGVILLVLIGIMFFRWKVARLQRDMENRGQGGGYRNGANGYAREDKREGDVTLKRTASSGGKRVNKSVGDYVDYEDVNEK